MNWWKNGLLLAAGGVAGLALAAWLESESKEEEFCNGECFRKENPMVAIGMLADKVRRDAEWAMAECTSDEEREKVYAQVRDSIEEFKAILENRGEEIVAGLGRREVGVDAEQSDEVGGKHAKSSMETLAKSLEETLTSLRREYDV